MSELKEGTSGGIGRVKVDMITKPGTERRLRTRRNERREKGTQQPSARATD